MWSFFERWPCGVRPSPCPEHLRHNSKTVIKTLKTKKNKQLWISLKKKKKRKKISPCVLKKIFFIKGFWKCSYDVCMRAHSVLLWSEWILNSDGLKFFCCTLSAENEHPLNVSRSSCQKYHYSVLSECTLPFADRWNEPFIHSFFF